MRSLLSRRVRVRALHKSPPLSSLGSSIASSFSTQPPQSAGANQTQPDQLHRTLTVTLTPAEDNLFAFLEYIQKLYAPTTQLRVAGGWVRDKLRSADSEDIDIALNDLRGAKFAQLITKFQRERNLPPSSVGVVKANSEKSKHLEVATVTIEGSTVDLVHLRAEQYTNGSRVPEVTFATPEDDASRRDLTINALFYNLHTRSVEDFTGRGVEDLRAGVIRTPREPVQTFLDDPLRVLRALRFACEFGFKLDPALVSAVMEKREIVGAMRRKVSRERIGIEVRKMLSGKDPARAFSLLASFDLLELVFNDKAGKLGEVYPADVELSETNTFQYPPREWTEPIQKRAFHFLKYLQQSRTTLANCQISNIEATSAIFTPLFLPTVPEIVPDDHSSLSHPAENQDMIFDGVTEEEIIESALEFLNHRETHLSKQDSIEIVEMLKVHVKWPKPAGKRVALILEAVATYPEVAGDSDIQRASVKHRLKRFMWMTQYYTVIAPALTILTAARNLENESDAKAQEAMLMNYLDLAATYAKENSDAHKNDVNRCHRISGKEVQTTLGPGANKNVARALRVLQVWEKVYPHGSQEEELAFLQRLAPQLS
ncbi:CCA tRNA nucleotidyltransferase, mitochondrial [Phytophthora boehmeriae]|uniref:CCA tRNA nucleotidyltransferase, mitochondrial n=1 Tax=Phytophthora boehmeriae TaxID=109152 RepID=A0A8T1VP87_9STRA|nr:CCA tRNA nucleotidyltransferase, mitochondrial [Phytophthora boehmeriae]